MQLGKELLAARKPADLAVSAALNSPSSRSFAITLMCFVCMPPDFQGAAVSFLPSLNVSSVGPCWKSKRQYEMKASQICCTVPRCWKQGCRGKFFLTPAGCLAPEHVLSLFWESGRGPMEAQRVTGLSEQFHVSWDI